MTKYKVLLITLLFAVSGIAAAQSRIDEPMSLQEKLASVQSVAFLKQIADIAFKNQDWPRYIAAVRRAAELQPYNQRTLFQLAAGYSLAGQRSHAYDLLLQLQQEGLSGDIESEPAFDNIRGHEVYDYIVFLFEENEKPFGEGRVDTTIKQPERIFEALAYDPVRDAMLVGSVRDGAISIVGDDGSLQTLVTADQSNNLAGVFSLGVDAKRDLLWATSANVPPHENAVAGNPIVNRLHKFRLSSGELLETYDMQSEQPQLFSALALAPNGDVFVADRISPSIYRLIDGESELTHYVSVRGKRGFRGLAMAENGHFLYAADPTYGLFAIDLEQQRVIEMTKPKLNLGGIEGVSISGNELVIVQNGIRPNRVLALTLADDGFNIESEQPIEANHPVFEVPTAGFIQGRDFYYIGNSQRGRFDGTGTPLGPLDDLAIIRTNLDFETYEPPKMFDPNKGKPPVGISLPDDG